MALRNVTADRVRRIAFSPRGATVIIFNPLGLSDIYLFATEEEGMNIPSRTDAGAGNAIVAQTSALDANNNLIYGTKVAANGGQVNWVSYNGEVWAVASGFATPAAGGAAVETSGFSFVAVRVLPG